MKTKTEEIKKIEPTSYGVRTTSETYGFISDISFDWTGMGWAIQRLNMRYTHRGDWIHTPQPSSRTKQFFRRTLWDFEEGMKVFESILNNYEN